MTRGRMIWAENSIRSIELQQDRAKAVVKDSDEDCTISFNVNSSGDLESVSDWDDKKICSIIYAICIEIDLLLATYVEPDEIIEQECDEPILENKSKT
jgi:hypothetical protein